MHYALVAAITNEAGLGYQGNLPWHPRRLKLDMSFFQFITKNDYSIDRDAKTVTFSPPETEPMVIMGRKTWESLPPKWKPLPGRRNVIISRNQGEESSNVTWHTSPVEALAKNESFNSPAYLLGGSAIYTEGLDSDGLECAFVTELFEHPELPADVYFPAAKLKRFNNKINITKTVFDQLSMAINEDQRLIENGSDPYFTDKDISYRIYCYY